MRHLRTLRRAVCTSALVLPLASCPGNGGMHDADGSTAHRDAAGADITALTDATHGADGHIAPSDAMDTDAVVAPRDASPGDAAPVDVFDTNPACPSLVNAPGAIVNFPWPAMNNTGHRADPAQSVLFHWSGTHNVLQVADWLEPLRDPGWPNAIRSGAPTANGMFQWNVGAFPCGYRPGLYYFADQDNAVNGVVAISVTEPEGRQSHYAPRACSMLSSPSQYAGRYGMYASRANCTLYEVNNFQTEPHYDWVPPTFGATQGDLVLFRWTGSHNVVQVHDVLRDEPYAPRAINSGAKRNCAGGPNYTCANGPASLGEHLIDTATWRPGMIHLSDECAYNRASCAMRRPGPESPTGMNMQFLLSRRQRPTVSAPGACCAIDRSKGQACRVIDVYNDNAGMQFDYNVGINRGDIVRIRWGGTIRIVQTTPNTNGSPSRTPRPGGVAMETSVECVPGPDWTCLDDNTAQAQLVLDVGQMITRGQYQSTSWGQKQFTFQAYGENTDGFSSADSGMLFYVENDAPYASNPPCP